MTPDLENILYAKYPHFFARRHLPSSQTCMCWGITTPDDWFETIDTLVGELVAIDPNLQAEQIKEKFNTLRVYLLNYGSNPDTRSKINECMARADRAVNKIERLRYENRNIKKHTPAPSTPATDSTNKEE